MPGSSHSHSALQHRKLFDSKEGWHRLNARAPSLPRRPRPSSHERCDESDTAKELRPKPSRIKMSAHQWLCFFSSSAIARSIRSAYFAVLPARILTLPSLAYLRQQPRAVVPDLAAVGLEDQRNAIAWSLKSLEAAIRLQGHRSLWQRLSGLHRPIDQPRDVGCRRFARDHAIDHPFLKPPSVHREKISPSGALRGGPWRTTRPWSGDRPIGQHRGCRAAPCPQPLHWCADGRRVSP